MPDANLPPNGRLPLDLKLALGVMIFVALLAGSAFVVRFNGARSAQVDAASPVPTPPLPGAVTPASTPPLASAVAPVPTTRPSSETSSTPDEEIVVTPRLGLTGQEKLAHDKLVDRLP